MKWNAEWGPQLKALLNAWDATGNKPAELDARPLLSPYQTFLQGAYELLDRGRPESLSKGLRYIPLSEINAFCNLFGVEDTEYFATVIRRADDAVIPFVAELAERKAKIDEMFKNASKAQNKDK